MAEKSSELERVDKLDPVSTSAGAGNADFVETYSEDYSDPVRGELDNVSDVPEETEQIKARIEETRNQMGETIDAIQERLSFANISEQVSETVSNAIETAKDTAYDATIGKAVNFMRNVGDGVTHSNALRTVRQNPFPFALIGIGAGLLAYQTYSKGSSRRGNGHDRRYDGRGNGESRVGLASAAVTGATGRAYDGISDTAGKTYESVKNVAGTALETVSGTVSNVYAEAGDVAHKAYEKAGEFGTVAYEKY